MRYIKCTQSFIFITLVKTHRATYNSILITQLKEKKYSIIYLTFVFFFNEGERVLINIFNADTAEKRDYLIIQSGYFKIDNIYIYIISTSYR